MNKTLAKYNLELLCIAEILCRIVYEDEMEITRKKLMMEILSVSMNYMFSHFIFKQSSISLRVEK